MYEPSNGQSVRRSPFFHAPAVFRTLFRRVNDLRHNPCTYPQQPISHIEAQVRYVSVLLWLGVTVLYIGFAAVLGMLARRAANGSTMNSKCLAWLHGICIFIPASIFVLWMPESTPWVQIPVFLSGLAAVYLAFKQPKAIPARLWQRTFALRYFGASMAFATLWGLSILLADEVLLILPFMLATSFASTISFISAPRIT